MPRTVFPNSMVCHVWAQQRQDEGRNHKDTLYFKADTIFSYGSHFPVARFVQNGQGARAVLFNRHDYSPTTSQHKNEVRRAIPGGLPIFTVDQPGQRYSATPSAEALNWKDYENRVRELFERASRARSNREWLLQQASDLIDEANRFAEFFGLPERIEKPSDLAEALNQARQRATEREARARVEREQRNAKSIAAFRAGDIFYGHIEGPLALLRLRPNDPATIHTSKGAEFPVEHGIKAFRFMSAMPAHLMGLLPNTQADFGENGPRLGHFRISSIQDGIIRAGCHRVAWVEVQALARTLGLIEAAA